MTGISKDHPAWAEAERIRSLIASRIPQGTVTAEHTDTAHFYRYAPTGELFSSVTTKCDVMGEKHIKGWAVKTAIDHVRENWKASSSSDSEFESMLLEAQGKPNGIFEDAGDIGTRIHAVVEDWIRTWMSTREMPQDIRRFIPQGDADPRLASAARAAEAYCRDNDIIPVCSELLVASPRHKVAGTLDFLALRGNTVRDGDQSCKHELWQQGSDPSVCSCTRCGLKKEYRLALIDWKSSNVIRNKKYMMQTAAYWECLRELTGLKPESVTIVGLSKKDGSFDAEPIPIPKLKKAFKAYASVIALYGWANSPDCEFEQKERKVLEM